jgi:TetR/AcrR family transcriptional regulator, lmrAB and yxaGH operons repressor
MIRSAAHLFQRHGFLGTGLRDIVEDCGAPRGSIYFHFPDGKEALGAEAVEFWERATVKLVDRCAESAKDPAHLVGICAQALAHSMQRSGFVDGCPVAVTALEMTPGSETLRVACDAMFLGWQDALRRHFCAGGLSEERATSLASATVSILEGALILSRASMSTTPLEIAGQELASLVRGALPQDRARAEAHTRAPARSSGVRRAAARPT